MLDKVPSNAELRRILSHMDVKGKSLFLVLASSGMRIGEALRLKVEDVDLTSDPPKINIRGEYTKTGNPRIAFISFEARESLEEWLKNREGELKLPKPFIVPSLLEK
jgi:integrase